MEIIRTENLGKSYIINHEFQEDTLRDLISNKLKRGNGKKEKEEFWALKNLDLSVNQGDKLGIIGRNGAGKSTFLKLLSRITEPTEGKIGIKGRVASLLEVGTGFHPELTGRENIFLSGAILGMSRQEIKSKFDEIVLFAEVEKFLDTPVKRYSSGMYVRLAFSVAAFLETEILLVDEVLAVGDTNFQKKCIDKMVDLSIHGKTILFVSHNLSFIKSFCNKALLLKDGEKEFIGSVNDSITIYNSSDNRASKSIELEFIQRTMQTKGDLIFKRIEFSEMPIQNGSPIRFRIELKSFVDKKHSDLDFGVMIKDINNSEVIHCSNRFISVELNHENDSTQYNFEIENQLKAGSYRINLFLRTGDDEIQDWLIDGLNITVEEGNPYGFHKSSSIFGIINPRFSIEALRYDQV